MAEEQTLQERTEQPTPRRLQEARKEGRIPRSQELSSATVLLAGALSLGVVAGGVMGRQLTDLLRQSAQAVTAGPFESVTAVGLLREVGWYMLAAYVPFAVGVAAIALLVNAVQAQGVLSAKPMQPKWSNISPLAGLKRIVSIQGLFTLAKSLVKLVVLAALVYLLLRRAWPELTSLPLHEPAGVLTVLRRVLLRLVVATGFALLLLAIADYTFQRFQYVRNLRMTRQEVQRERKDTEGDPLIKSRVRTIQRALSRQRMLRDVETADVVVTNPTHLAVALKYDIATGTAPIVVAMGQRKLAERIKQIATQAGVSMIENRPLAQALLSTATVGRPIPPALYTAVAEIIAFVFQRSAAKRRQLAAAGAVT